MLHSGWIQPSEPKKVANSNYVTSELGAFGLLFLGLFITGSNRILRLEYFSQNLPFVYT